MNPAGNLSPEDKADFVDALVGRLVPGAEPGFFVKAGTKNTFEIAAAKNGEWHGVLVKNENSRSFYGPWRKPIPVKELSARTRAMYPGFILPACRITATELEARYGVPKIDACSMAFDAIARRVNAKGVVFEIYEIVQGQGWTTVSSVRCGRSIAEAVLRLAV